jgi:hypothetical protein
MGLHALDAAGSTLRAIQQVAQAPKNASFQRKEVESRQADRLAETAPKSIGRKSGLWIAAVV